MTYDPRKPKGTRMTIQDILDKFHREMPEGTHAYNLGSGQRPLEGYKNVDVADIPSVDVVADLFGTDWPIEADSAGLVWMSHFMEHVPNWGQFWTEVWRIMADNGRVVILSPWFMSDRYWQDPSHCQPLLDAKFAYLSRMWRTENQIEHSPQYPDVNFVMEFNTVDSWHPRLTPYAEEAKQDAKLSERNAITDCVWFLRALKTPESQQDYLERVAKDMQA